VPSRAHRIAIAAAAVVAVGVPALGMIAVRLARGAPRADRVWAADQAVEPSVAFAGSRVTVAGVRDFRHRARGAPDVAYRAESFDLAAVRTVWFALAPFAERWRGLAHTFVSFGLEDGRYIAVSVEARRERDESYSLVGGLSRRFEVAYVIGTESDLIGLRALRGDTLYLYPSRASPDQARALLADMLARAEALRTRPEFYNTLTNNCATNLRDHVNRVVAEPLPFGWGVIFPGYSDELALARGLLATELPLAEARRRFRVDERARAALADGRSDFSERIRAAD
jgi:hypothetical protein